MLVFWGKSSKWLDLARASERNFSRGYEDRCRAPKITWSTNKKIKKRSSLKIGPIFCPKSGEKPKKRFTLKIGSIFCPKSGKEQKKIFTQNWSYFLPPPKKVFTQNWSLFSAQSQGPKKGKEEKNFGQNLTRQPQLFRAPLNPGTMYPLNPPLVGPGPG